MAVKNSQLAAPRMFSENVSALLHARNQKAKSLALWCRKSENWISKILKNKTQARMEDLDRIADFFGIATYQLFQPGISSITERRRAQDRRSGQDRRISHEHRLMMEVRQEIERHRPQGRFRKTPAKAEVS